MRVVLVIGVVLGGALLASCSSTGAYIGDNLPEWAGGLPKGTPPRPGSPGYEAYLREIHGGDRPTAAPPSEAQSYAAPQPPVAAPQPAVKPSPSPPRPPRQPIDDPIH